jgi:hypothetical protein
MSRMNAAWSNSDQWMEAIPEIFKQPMTIAFGGAILAHGIFFLGLPAVVGKENPPDVQPVTVVELTPEERASTPMDLPTTPLPTTGTLLPGGLLPGGLLPGGLLPGGLMTPGLTTPGLTTPAPNSLTTPPVTGFSFDQPNIGSSFSQPTFQTNNASNSDNAAVNARLAEIAKKQEELKRKEEQAKKDEQARQDQQRIAGKPAIEGIQPGQAPTPEQLARQSSLPPHTPANSTPGQPSQPPAVKRPSDSELIAANPERYKLKVEKTGPTIGAKIQDAFQIWIEKPESKQAEIYLASQGKVRPQRFEVNTPTKTLPYPTDIAAIPDYEQQVKNSIATAKGRPAGTVLGTAIVGFVLNAGGRIVSEPDIIQSTGYDVLDEYVKRSVMNRPFPINQKGMYYMVVPVDPPVTQPAA